MINKLFIIFFVLLLIVFPTGELLRIKITNNVYVVPQDFIASILFFLSSYNFIIRKEKPRDDLFVLFFLFFIGFGTVSLVINSFINPSYNFVVSLLYGVRLIIYAAIFLYPLTLRNKIRANSLIFFSGSAIVITGIFQYLYYNDLGFLRYLGWDNHMYRLFSSFLDPNFAGIFYVIFLGFLVVRVNSLLRTKLPAFEMVILFLTVLSIYLTYSRSAFLAFIVFAFVLFFLRKNYLRIAIFLPLLVVFYFLFSDKMVEGLNPFRTISSIERVKSFNNTVVILKDNSIIGIGFNAFRYAQIKYGFRSSEGALISNSDAGTDNSFLFILTTTGIIGFALFVASYFFLLTKLYSEKTFEGNIYFASVLSVFFGSLFVNALFYIPIISFLFLILAFRHSKN